MTQHILLVEDCEEQATLLSRWLSKDLNVTVAIATSAEQALARADLKRFHVIIADLCLPDMDGLGLIAELKKRVPLTPLVLATAHATLDAAVAAANLGVFRFIQKPMGRAGYCQTVQEALDAGAATATHRPEVVLAIGAHPDDVEIGVGGTLLSHRERGDHVVLLTLSGGEAGGETSTRATESRRAAVRLGAELVLGDCPDTRITDGPETIDWIARVVREVQPTIVYTHSSHDVHQDHRAVNRATLVAARSVPTLYCYQSPSAMASFVPHAYSRIDEYMDRKLDLIAEFATQTLKSPYLDPDLIRATARYWGRFAGYGYVEPLEVVRTAPSRMRHDEPLGAAPSLGAITSHPPLNAQPCAAQ